MAITSVGYERAITYAELGSLIAHAGATYSVSGDASSFAVAVEDASTQILVRPGVAYGCGIIDTSDSIVTLTGTPPATGDRWDLVALRRDWAAKTSTPVLIAGGPTMTIPNRNTEPGVLDDQPLALIRYSAGQAGPVTVRNLRVWRGSGGCFARDLLVRDYHTEIGTRIYISDRTYVLILDGIGQPKWVTDSVIFSTTQPSPADVPWLQIPA